MSHDDEVEEATKAADHGDTGAMVKLGLMLGEQGDLEAAEAWYLRAAHLGDADAMHRLGLVLSGKGDLKGATTWFRRAAENGQASSMSNLGLILKAQGDLRGAEMWYRWAARAGNASAMSNLGMLLNEKGDLGGAEMWYVRAAGMGNLVAMHNLGHLLKTNDDFDGAEAWFRRSVDGGNAATMIDLGLLRQDVGDLRGAEAWFARAAEARVPQGHTNLESLRAKISSDGDLGSITFDVFGWPQTRNRDKFRQWRSDDGSLAVRFIAGPSDFRSWNVDEIRRDFLERLEFLQSPNVRIEDLDLPEWYGNHQPTEFPEQVTLLEVDCFAIHPAKCVQAMYRHRMRGGVHYSTGIFILFAACFWLLRLEVQEGHVVGEREGAVARRALDGDTAGDSLLTRFDPYHRRWDGIVPLEDDPLTRMRLLAARLRGSLRLGQNLLGLEPFTPAPY